MSQVFSASLTSDERQYGVIMETSRSSVETWRPLIYFQTRYTYRPSRTTRRSFRVVGLRSQNRPKKQKTTLPKKSCVTSKIHSPFFISWWKRFHCASAFQTGTGTSSSLLCTRIWSEEVKWPSRKPSQSATEKVMGQSCRAAVVLS